VDVEVPVGTGAKLDEKIIGFSSTGYVIIIY
jgi:hypothetical protein